MKAVGDHFAGRFQKLSEVETGGTATVFKAFDHETNGIVALKVFTSAGRDPEIVNEVWHRETSALSSIDHESVVRFIDAGRDERSSERFIALEWIDGSTLENHLLQIGPVSWEVFYRDFGASILDALSYAAERNVSHRDLSTGNVLVTPTGIKIIDFGQAKVSSSIIGRTVMGWKTVPYCLPEDDTGTYTLTRDPYAFSAIVVRALCGHGLSNHEELYAALATINLPDDVRTVVSRSLSREPAGRFPTILEFRQALELGVHPRPPAHAQRDVPFRLTPVVVEKLRGDGEHDPAEGTELEILAREMNELVALSIAPENSSGTRVQAETRSFRLVFDIDAAGGDHIVVVSAVRRRFRQLDAILQSDRWNPPFSFSTRLPRTPAERHEAVTSVRALYHGLEDHLAERAAAERRNGASSVVEWTKLLEALRYLARTSVPPLRYTQIEKVGASRLAVVVENPDDATEEQLRTISVEKSWVFRGEIESILGNRIVLLSTRPHFAVDRIPSQGELEIDWQQTRVALERQAKAVEKFRASEVPSENLARLITGAERGEEIQNFAKVPEFFDSSLDDAKKAIVARFMAGADLIVTHGPPGTGKTKLIVELLRQALRLNPDHKILLASQTHVALDNALERLLAVHPSVSCVRIGSGSKEADERVATCSLDKRSVVLRDHVTKSAEAFISERATQLGVNRKEVELGLAVLDLLGSIADLERRDESIASKTEDLEAARAQLGADVSASTEERSGKAIRVRTLDDALEQARAERVVAAAEVHAAKQKLRSLGSEGRSLSKSTVRELQEWTEVLLEDGGRKALGELMQLAESWRLRFGQSGDFKAAIISSSDIVAGTCVGFCREEAASRSTFDVCIIDEAGKATTTELLVPLAQSKRAVLLGDHHQLPAVLDHAVRSKEIALRFGLRKEQLDEHLFETLARDLAEGCKAELVEQYRMRGEIGRLISQCFYHGRLIEHPSLAERDSVDLSLAGLDSEVVWLDPYGDGFRDAEEQPIGTSFRNQREAKCIVALLRRIRFVLEQQHIGKSWPSIGVIAGYAPQVNLIRSEIRRDPSLDKLNVDCSTVHSFQGREVDICIYSVTRKNSSGRIGMLKDWRHLNVALSRARDNLVIVGSVRFCREVEHENPFDRIVRFFESSSKCTVAEWTDA